MWHAEWQAVGLLTQQSRSRQTLAASRGVERSTTIARWRAGRDVFVRIYGYRWEHDGAWLHVKDVERV